MTRSELSPDSTALRRTPSQSEAAVSAASGPGFAGAVTTNVEPYSATGCLLSGSVGLDVVDGHVERDAHGLGVVCHLGQKISAL